MHPSPVCVATLPRASTTLTCRNRAAGSARRSSSRASRGPSPASRRSRSSGSERLLGDRLRADRADAGPHPRHDRPDGEPVRLHRRAELPGSRVACDDRVRAAPDQDRHDTPDRGRRPHRAHPRASAPRAAGVRHDLRRPLPGRAASGRSGDARRGRARRAVVAGGAQRRLPRGRRAANARCSRRRTSRSGPAASASTCGRRASRPRCSERRITLRGCGCPGTSHSTRARAASISSPDEVLDAIPEIRALRAGLLHVHCAHTSASLTLNENASAGRPS